MIDRPDFQLRVLPNPAILRLQAFKDWGGLVDSTIELPMVPNQLLGGDPYALWLAPNDWLVYAQAITSFQLGATFRESRYRELIITDVSSGSVVIELGGTRALDVLARDCTLDLESASMAYGRSARTTIAQVGIIIHRLPNAHQWRLLVDRSTAGYLADWLSQD